MSGSAYTIKSCFPGCFGRWNGLGTGCGADWLAFAKAWAGLDRAKGDVRHRMNYAWDFPGFH